MMDAAEAMAVERGALTATLETHSFQAPDFYMKRGYGISVGSTIIRRVTRSFFCTSIWM
jgi:hypothetical protein